MKAGWWICVGVMACSVVCGSAQAQAGAASKFTAFDVASVRENKSGDGPSDSTFPMGPGDVYVPNGGHYRGVDMPLIVYINFAFKAQANQAEALYSALPDWAKHASYDIEGRVEGDPGKDDMRVMMRKLLEDRFGMKWHSETHEIAVLDLVPIKPGKLGPALVEHPVDKPCTRNVSGDDMRGESSEKENGFNTVCGGLLGGPSSTPGMSKLFGRDITMALFASSIMQAVDLGKPVKDKTGLTGRYDLSVEFAPTTSTYDVPTMSHGPADETGPTFSQAVERQLGLKLVPAKGDVETIVIDRIERPSEN